MAKNLARATLSSSAPLCQFLDTSDSSEEKSWSGRNDGKGRFG